MSQKNCCGGCDPNKEVTSLEPGMVATLLPGESLAQVDRQASIDQTAKGEKDCGACEPPDRLEDSQDRGDEAAK